MVFTFILSRLYFIRVNKVEFILYTLQKYLPENFKTTVWVVGGGLVTESCLMFATPWTVARQVPWSVGFSRQEYWSGLPFPSLFGNDFQITHFLVQSL